MATSAQDTGAWKNRSMSKQVSAVSRGASAADKDTPRPGLYHIRDFIEEGELNPVKRTYGFKGVGRRDLTLGQRRGDLLLPGAYNLTDSTQEALKRQATYSFKNSPRPENVSYGIRDKDLRTSPCDYNVAAKPVEKIPCKEGPAPGEYSPEYSPGRGITSSFKSTLPRLHYVHPKTPGPGAYEPFWKLGDRVTTVMDPSFSFFFRNLP